MPNNVLNRLTIKDKEDAQEVFSFMGVDEGLFDFERICPIPPHVYKGNINAAVAQIFGQTSIFKGDGDTWLSWCREHWGTKWNAYDFVKVDENTIEFETAWSPVPRIILLLCQKFDIREFTYEWADEDFGSNTGMIRGLDWGGDLHIDVYKPINQTKEAFDMASKVRIDYVRTDDNGEGFYWDEENHCIEYDDGESTWVRNEESEGEQS